MEVWIRSEPSLLCHIFLVAGSVQYVFSYIQAVWAIGNIAGDGPEFRDVVLHNGAMEYILKILSSDLKDKQNASWALSNLCHGKKPLPPSDKVCKNKD